MFGSHVIKSWSSTQAVIALSSGKAEYYSMVKGASIGLGIHAMMREIGVIVHLGLRCDASAAIGIVLRRGLGKVRHIDVSQLWLQHKVASGEIQVKKVGTGENKSDALTKYLSYADIVKHMKSTSQVFMDQKS